MSTVSQKSKKTVSVVICAYNEEQTVATVVQKVLSLEGVDELVVVNNGSTDSTGLILTEWGQRDSRLKVIHVPKNKGLGDGLVRGMRATTGDIVVRQDADLEYDPVEIADLIQPIASGKGSVVFGSRMLVRRTHRCNYYYNYLANVLFTTLVNSLVNLNFTDVETAAKAFDGALIRSIQFVSRGFDIEIEMTFKLRRVKAVFYEVPISYYGRTIEEGKKIRVKDAFHTLWAIFKYAFLVRRVGQIQ